MNTWLIIAAIVAATAVIIAHQEWRYRRMVEWLDALGQMLSDWKDEQ